MSSRFPHARRCIVWLTAAVFVPAIAESQEHAAANPAAGDLAGHWTEIDADQVALIERLVKVEASLDCLAALLERGEGNSAKSTPAPETNADQKSDQQHPSAVIPWKWTEFYRNLVERFYVRADSKEPFHFTRAALENSDRVQETLRTGQSGSKTVESAPELSRFQDLNQAYVDAKALAEAEFKAMPIAELRTRAQALEAEQGLLWRRIALRTILSRDPASKPLYRFQPYVAAIGLVNVQRTKAMTAAVLYMRTNLDLVAAAGDDQGKSVESMPRLISEARNQLEESWDKAVSKDVAQDLKQPVAKFISLTKKLDETARSIADCEKTIVEKSTPAGAQQRNRARSDLQDSVLRYAEITLAMNELLDALAADWQIKSDKFNPLLVGKPGEQLPAPQPQNLSLANQLAKSMEVYRQQINANPRNAQAHKNLAIAIVKHSEAMGEVPLWDDAASEFAAAIDLLPDNTSTISPRKGACRELAQWDELFNSVVQIRPDETSLWIGRAEYQVQHSQWKEALAELTKIIANRPIHDDTFDYACLLVWLGDTDTYEKFCRELAARPGQPQDDFAAYIMARVCMVGPCKSVELNKVIGWIEKAAQNEAAAYRLHVLGLAYYRVGQYDMAIQYLEKSNANNWTDAARSMNWLLLAMAYHQLHKPEQAAQCLQTAHRFIATAAPKQPGGAVDLWAPDWVEYQVLSREADALLQESNKESKSPAAEK